ncbi:MAG: 50S ribosomal protein L3 [Ignavibacteriales bacterium]|jgi:large subunit ribosomal protein L3|nr:50S ribosomal protein L3 [Ignavibacteriales bacterium]MBP7542044.1 50S ribosomal protein L3 [Ignavibacteriaceae bacterium]MBK7265601.1 50S ribosomal protein L3 [Ignavibacteriales bacterium]MBK8661485.1 50S ribosomal protein L3 [Ignavibacteriales bacterium]MBP9121513.1 50S ribosomal protein L3 [Ignavibacteriaceae bacterium]
MLGILGKKIGMSAIFDENGVRIPVTIIEAGPCVIAAVKSIETDGYNAIQLGYGQVREKNLTKPEIGHFKKNNLTPVRHLREFRVDSVAEYKVGDNLDSGIFTVGEKIKVSGKSKGKGFQGVMKRHGFGGVGGTTHGQSDRLRAPGSIGSSSYPSRVFPGMKMAGRMGNDNVSVRNLQVIKIIAEKNIILVKGAVPGATNSIVELYKK